MKSTGALCPHIKSVLSGKISDDEIQDWIGSLGKLDPATFMARCKDMSFILSRAFEGNYEFSEHELEVLGLRRNLKELEFVDISGRVQIPTMVPADKVFTKILQMPANSSETQRIWASLMKLKTILFYEESRLIPSDDRYKAFRSITDPYVGDDSILDELRPYVKEVTRHFCRQVDPILIAKLDRTYLPIGAFPATDKRSFVVSRDGQVTTAARDTLVPYNYISLLRIPEVLDIYNQYPEEFITRVFIGERVVDGTRLELPEEEPFERGSIPLIGISFIPELGLKARVVAVPTVLLQSLTYSLGLKIKSLNSSWDIQGFDSHPKACEKVHSWISQHEGTRTFHSIDMSSFTDRFPYEGLQSVVLDTMLEEGIITPMERISMDLVCHSPIQFEDKVTHYGVGTPMGTFPSFPLATFTHGAVLAAAYMQTHPNKKIDYNLLPAVIVGDDFCGYDDVTIERYKSLMGRLGVPVQPAKCIVSQYAAEICSKMITSNGVFEQKKLKPFEPNVLSNAIAQYRYYGRSVQELYSVNVQDIISALEEIPYPYGFKEFPLEQAQPGTVERIYYAHSLAALSAKWDPSFHMDALDYTILHQRRTKVIEPYIKDVTTIPAPSDDNLIRYCNDPVIRSLTEEIRLLREELSSPAATLDSMLLCAEEIACKYNALLDAVSKYGYSLDYPPQLGTHIHGKDLPYGCLPGSELEKYVNTKLKSEGLTPITLKKKGVKDYERELR